MTNTHEPWTERILRVLDYIHDHLDDSALTPEVLADVAGFSRHHFHRVFRGMVGESAMGCIRRLRLERAAQQLRFTKEPVTDVALGSGYQSHEAFTRAFRARFGLAPSGFRTDRRPSDTSVQGRMTTMGGYDVLAVRHVGAYETCTDAWDRLDAFVAAHGLASQVQASCGLVYDDPEITETDRLRYDACVALPASVLDRLAVPAGAARRHVPAGRYGVALYVGPYEDIMETYVRFLGGWLPFRGVDLVNEPIVEVYLNDPHNNLPEHLRTEICVRLDETTGQDLRAHPSEKPSTTKEN